MARRLTHVFTAREWLLLLMLTAVQFCHILDFVIIMPLSPMLMRSLHVSPSKFGLLVSAYTFSAAVSGLVAAAYMDRFDRKRMLLFLLAGFGFGTLLCGLVESYWLLMAARIVAGAFGGVLAGVVFAIVGDQIRAERRGTAMGVVMGAFSAASVLGLPLGLWLAENYTWEMPFRFLAGVTAVVFVIGLLALPPMAAHLTGRRADDPSPFRELWEVGKHPSHINAFLLTIAVMFSAFTVVPFLAPYLTTNVGMAEDKLALMYLVGGLATLLTGPLVFGPLADRFGHARVFTLTAVLSLVPIALVTNLPRVELPVILAVTTLMMVMASGRMISVTALVTGVVEPRRRGGFMSLNSSIQQGAAGAASYVAGLMIGGGEGQPLTGYSRVGLLAIVATLLTLYLIRRLRPAAATAAVPQFDAVGAPEEAAPLEAPRRPAADGVMEDAGWPARDRRRRPARAAED
ncbi:MFS transporter [Longimicrobium sp.]|uniref:MFS transporter n=1 Tax=Longimicrobium sp. TaxID=2029185 RepID=UPI002E337D16|nr:MFS transporter [Longimicrobium sp.]HEX6042782.1 MFS transporter [Longimicrobium sp.]